MCVPLFLCLIISITSDLSDSLLITLGGADLDGGYSVQQTFDQGYIVTGYTRSFGAGDMDLLLAKFYSNGSLDWATTLGGSDGEEGYSVQQTSDGGFIVTGYSRSVGGGSNIYAILAKFYSNGSLDWATARYEEGCGSQGRSVQQTTDDGYIMAGFSDGYGEGNMVFLAKFWSNGSLDWETMIGGNDIHDEGYSVQQTFDGGYILTGFTEDGSTRNGPCNVLLAKFYSSGSLDWSIKIGGASYDFGYSVQQTADGGYIVAGRTYTFGAGSMDVFLAKFDTDGSLDWAIALGENTWEELSSVEQTSDGNYIVTGFADEDILLAKFYSDGNLDWAFTFCGSEEDKGYSVQQTVDGGYIFTGSTKSFGGGEFDVFLAKVDQYGNDMFNEECPISVVEYNPQFEFLEISEVQYYPAVELLRNKTNSFQFFTPDVDRFWIDVGKECYVLATCYGQHAGQNDSDVCSGNGECSSEGLCNCYENYYGLVCNITQCYGIFSNDSATCGGRGECAEFDTCSCLGEYFGEICEERQYSSFFRKFGGSERDGGNSVQQTLDGGYIVTGSTYSFGAGLNDVLLSKFSNNGSLVWAVSLGGDERDEGNSVQQTLDGGYVVTGYFGDDGSRGVLLAKFHSNGSLEWANTLGVDEYDEGFSVRQTSHDGGYVVTGLTGEMGTGDDDAFLAKYYANGSVEWVKTFGGGEDDEGHSVQQTSDGGYIVAGVTWSFCTGSCEDVLLVKVHSDGSLDWAVTIGGDEDDVGYSVEQTVPDGGYVVTGQTESYGDDDVFLAKFHSNGYLDWLSTFGSGGYDVGYSVQQTFDGGYIVGGTTTNFGSYFYDPFLVKFDYDGYVDWGGIHGGSYYDYGYSAQQTYDGGYVVTGKSLMGAGGDVFLAKVYSDGQGCGFSRIPDEDIESEFEFVEGVFESNPALDYQDIQDYSVVYITSSSSFEFVSDQEELQVSSQCSIEFACFGTSVESVVCSGHGNCTGVDVCTCESHYYGEQCEVQDCFGVLSNYSSLVCTGHGECIAHDVCVCDETYTFKEDCSLWKCFGKWNNDSDVCNGALSANNTGIESHGNCTSHDHCECEEGYRISLACDWECDGDPHWEEETCGSYGICIDYDVCNCTTTDYVGEDCDIPTCSLISSLDTEDVCSGHGECVSPNVCDCEVGYAMSEPGLCDWWTCFGIHWNEKDIVCSGEGNGECIEYNLCDCKESYEGEECETWICGFDKDDPKSCSGNGECISPSNCDCNYGFTGDLCETNILYATVMAPTLTVSGILGGVIFLLIVFCCCVCCCCVYCCAAVLVSGLIVFLFAQTFRWKKFSKLKNIDILLQEQQADENSDIAHIRVNKKLFEIPYKEIKVVKILGEGGSSSVVYLSTWRNQKVAYKCFKTRIICSTQETFDEFEKEAEIFSSISHPNCVGFYGCTIDPPRVGIVMEYCEKGECLEYILKFEVVHGKKYPMKERFRMLYEICSAMDYLHSRKIVHRDLKCENVLLNRMEQCKLMDFGLSKISDRLSKQVTKGIGTPYFMAPELVKGGGFYNEKCDVFSFSIMVFMLITGLSQPYPGDPVGIEFRVASDPNKRPDTNLMKDVLVASSDQYIWIIEETKRCWDHNHEKRPSFEELCQLFVEKNMEGVDISTTTKTEKPAISLEEEDNMESEKQVEIHQEVVVEDLKKNEVESSFLTELWLFRGEEHNFAGDISIQPTDRFGSGDLIQVCISFTDENGSALRLEFVKDFEMIVRLRRKGERNKLGGKYLSRDTRFSFENKEEDLVKIIEDRELYVVCSIGKDEKLDVGEYVVEVAEFEFRKKKEFSIQ